MVVKALGIFDVCNTHLLNMEDMFELKQYIFSLRTAIGKHVNNGQCKQGSDEERTATTGNLTYLPVEFSLFHPDNNVQFFFCRNNKL